VEQRATFNTIADLYGSARPGYPDALVGDIIAFAALSPGDAVLEVGCGAGQATAGFAKRGYRITALDPGAELIRVARDRLAGAADVDFIVSTFESWQAPRDAFRLVFAAQSWHWIDPGIGFAKAADALTEGGVLGVFGHVPRNPPEPLRTALEQVWRHHTGKWEPPPETAYLPGGPFVQLFDKSGLFEPVAHTGYAWIWHLTSQGYAHFMRTRSDHQLMKPEDREPLLTNAKAAVDALGGEFDWPFETHLYLARKSGRPHR